MKLCRCVDSNLTLLQPLLTPSLTARRAQPSADLLGVHCVRSSPSLRFPWLKLTSLSTSTASMAATRTSTNGSSSPAPRTSARRPPLVVPVSLFRRRRPSPKQLAPPLLLLLLRPSPRLFVSFILRAHADLSATAAPRQRPLLRLGTKLPPLPDPPLSLARQLRPSQAPRPPRRPHQPRQCRASSSSSSTNRMEEAAARREARRRRVAEGSRPCR
jgi:hypothetical protein